MSRAPGGKSARLLRGNARTQLRSASPRRRPRPALASRHLTRGQPRPVMQMRMPSVLRSLGTRQELGGREWIKVEHLGAGKLPVANLVEPEDWGVQLATGRVAPALVPQHHNLVLARSDNARAEQALGFNLKNV